jgi:hypothetical protein
MSKRDSTGEKLSASLKDYLSELGQNIVRDAEIDPSAEADAFETQIIQTIRQAVGRELIAKQERERESEADERRKMQGEEDREHRNLGEHFRQDLNGILNEIIVQIQKLSYGQQARIYRFILVTLSNILEQLMLLNTPGDTDQIQRISEITTGIINFTLVQVGATLSNLYDSAPEITTRTLAIITAGLMLYPYQPADVQELYVQIPYFGPFFATMNSASGFLRIVSNTSGTITSLFYLLRNAGIDLGPTLANLSEMGRTTVQVCARSGADAASTLLGKTARTLDSSANLVCTTGVNTIEQIGRTTTGLIRLLAERLSYYITPDYSNLRIIIDDNQDSQGSMPTRISTLTGQSQNSIMSQAAIERLLNTSRASGGAGSVLNQNLPSEEQSIVEDEFAAIIQGNPSDPIIATPIETANAPVPVADVEEVFYESQRSDISEMTEDGEEDFGFLWLFGIQRRGGRRLRKSRRHMKSKRTRKGRKGRRGKARITKKGRKHHRTLKRYKSKGRR